MLIEIGQHRAHVKHLEDENKKLERECNSLSEAKQTMRDEVIVLRTRVETLENEKNELKEMGRRQHDESRLRTRDLYEKLNRAYTHIKIQTGIMQGSKDGVKPTSTPHRHTYQQNSALSSGFGELYKQPPPLFGLESISTPANVMYSQTAAYHNQPIEDKNLSTQKRQSQQSNPWEAEDSSMIASTSPHSGATRKYPPGILPAPPGFKSNSQNSTNEASYQSTNMAPQSYYMVQEARVNLSAPLTKLFASVESWAKHYCNVPDKMKDTLLAESVRSQLFQVTNPAAAPSLIATSQTRYLAVTKLMLHMMVNYSFQPMVVKGFKSEYDYRLLYERQRIHIGCSSHVRRSATTNIAEIVREICRDPDWPAYLARTIQFQTQRLWDYVTHFLAPDVKIGEAKQGMFTLWEEALRIGQVMYSTTSLFSTDFPPVGEASFFNPANMVNRDPGFDQDPRTLGQMGLKIRLAITPVVTETNIEISGSRVVKYLCFAGVLLKR